MNRQALEQAKSQLRGYVRYAQPPENAGLWVWVAGPYSARSSFPSQAVAESDFEVFLRSDLRLEIQAKSGGRKESVKALGVKVRKRSRGSRYPDELLEFADQFEGSPKQRAVSACQYAKRIGVVRTIDGQLIQLVANDIAYYDQQKTA